MKKEGEDDAEGEDEHLLEDKLDVENGYEN